MKIGIDARFWGLEHAGLGRYVMELVRELSRIDKKNFYTIFLRRQYSKQLSFPDNFAIREADIRHYTLEEQWLLAEIFNREDLDLLHIPHFNVPLIYNKPFVVTIHDLLWHEVRGLSVTTLNPLSYLFKYLGYRWVVKHALHKSKAIIVPSKTIQQKLVNQYAVDMDKISITYEAPSRIFYVNKVDEKVLKKYGLTKPYFLYTGSIYPHKNLLKVVASAKKLQASGKDICLAIVSARSVFLEKLASDIRSMGAQNAVRFIGFVPDKELAYLYRRSVALIQPSLSEGFGLTGLEAMAAGTPVIASNIDIFREIYGSAALYFNPRSDSEITSALKRILENSRLRQQLLKKGKLRVNKASWKKLAVQTLTVYQSAIN